MQGLNNRGRGTVNQCRSRVQVKLHSARKQTSIVFIGLLNSQIIASSKNGFARLCLYYFLYGDFSCDYLGVNTKQFVDVIASLQPLLQGAQPVLMLCFFLSRMSETLARSVQEVVAQIRSRFVESRTERIRDSRLELWNRSASVMTLIPFFGWPAELDHRTAAHLRRRAGRRGKRQLALRGVVQLADVPGA